MAHTRSYESIAPACRAGGSENSRTIPLLYHRGNPKTGTGLHLERLCIFWIICQNYEDNNGSGNNHQDALAAGADKSKACRVFDGMICFHWPGKRLVKMPVTSLEKDHRNGSYENNQGNELIFGGHVISLSSVLYRRWTGNPPVPVHAQFIKYYTVHTNMRADGITYPWYKIPDIPCHYCNNNQCYSLLLTPQVRKTLKYLHGRLLSCSSLKKKALVFAWFLYPVNQVYFFLRGTLCHHLPGWWENTARKQWRLLLTR